MSHSHYPLIVVGAGISGLTIARNHPHLPSLILEKSRGLGGRIATRREGDLVFDHGAQFYKHSKEQPFHWQSFLEGKDILKEWFSKEGTKFISAKPGLTQISKSLAYGMNILLNEKVVQVQDQGKQLALKTESDKSYTCDKLVITSPLPQALELLMKSKIPYPTDLNQVNYAKALIGLFQFRKPLDIQFTEVNQYGIYSMSGQRSKGLCSVEAVTVCMDPIFSEENFELPDYQILSLITQAIYQLPSLNLGPEDILYSDLKKWRYSHPFKPVQSKVPNQSLLGGRIKLAGDAFGGGSLHGAVRSALSVQFGK